MPDTASNFRTAGARPFLAVCLCLALSGAVAVFALLAMHGAGSALGYLPPAGVELAVSTGGLI